MYAGDPARCKGFLLQCSLFFTSNADMPETCKITHFLELLTGNALLWATDLWEQGGDSISSLEQFTARFWHVFDHSPNGRGTGEELLTMTQGSCCVAEYGLQLRTIAARSEWNEPALKAVFHQGLNPEIVTELACRDKHLTLDSLNDLTIRLDRLLQSRCPVRH